MLKEITVDQLTTGSGFAGFSEDFDGEDATALTRGEYDLYEIVDIAREEGITQDTLYIYINMGRFVEMYERTNTDTVFVEA